MSISRGDAVVQFTLLNQRRIYHFAASIHGEYVLLYVFICFLQVVSAIIIHFGHESDGRSRFYARYLEASITRARFLHESASISFEIGRASLHKTCYYNILYRELRAREHFSSIGLSLSYVTKNLSWQFRDFPPRRLLIIRLSDERVCYFAWLPSAVFATIIGRSMIGDNYGSQCFRRPVTKGRISTLNRRRLFVVTAEYGRPTV